MNDNEFNQCGFEAGKRVFNRGEYFRALSIFTGVAKRGHMHAQCALGHMYDTGKGTKPNLTLAAYWYGMAAEQEAEKAATYLELCRNRNLCGIMIAGSFFKLKRHNGQTLKLTGSELKRFMHKQRARAVSVGWKNKNGHKVTSSSLDDR